MNQPRWDGGKVVPWEDKVCRDCGRRHDPKRISCEKLDLIRAAERAAGWDPNP